MGPYSFISPQGNKYPVRGDQPNRLLQPGDRENLDNIQGSHNGTINRDGGLVDSIEFDNRTITYNRDIDGIITGWEDDKYEWTLTRVGGVITSWTRTEK